ncbi:alpha/beta hydrolase [Parasporobacterium paucivorans]|uniref:Alpha/beta hydrolase family protein n=1 Tax=Parasporobacterium paucivorans DSM 15970 TaxID=1122934 RepID=A0A1M6GH92_9FIRM|nr:alpha/beta hydrolase [Parasporobacterium paucivorans]SHJ09242.1 Alpha/beta hydrolase family protein [Parasporobacterium paucivorans DSM 15970]
MKRIFIGIAAILIIIAAAFFIYTGTYYHAAQEVGAFTVSDEFIEVEERDGNLVFYPAGENPETALVFYPGGKVEYTAYAPLMRYIAQEGYTCILVQMPFNLAVFDINAAESVMEEFPEIEDWYLGGHSLGGAMAASFVADQSGEIDGLFLLAAYSTVDLSGIDLDVLSIYGSEDGVLDMEKYGEYLSNLPKDASEEVVLDGGNHAQFGLYGEQKGDKTAEISAEIQQRKTAAVIVEWIEGTDE